jgi:UDP-2,3-diacylglucosamine pyrophosphatase LpxH
MHSYRNAVAAVLGVAFAAAAWRVAPQVPPSPAEAKAASAVAASAGPSASAPGVTIFISDLHLGFGRISSPSPASGGKANDPWHPMEDFRWFSEFDAFLTAVETLWTNKKRPAKLVIVGDFLELWQSPPENRDCVYDGSGAAVKDAKGPFLELAVKSNLSCRRDDALIRANRVLTAHNDVLKRIGRFASKDGNSVIIVPGNHDAALVFESVKQATLNAIGAPPSQVDIASQGYWRSRDGKVVAEHGHFIKGDVNSYGEFPVQCLNLAEQPIPCNGPSAQTYLQRPWGEKFVQDFYDRYEVQFPTIDNITSEAAGASLAVHASAGAERRAAVGSALKFLLLQQSVRQFVELLGPQGDIVDPPRWDVTAVRTKGDEFFEESLARSNPLREDIKQLRMAGQLDVHISQLTDDELHQICDVRFAMQSASAAVQGQPPDVCPGSPPKLGALKTKLLTTNAQRLAERMEEFREMLKKLPTSDATTSDFSVYVYAHTHAVHGPCSAHRVAGKKSQTADGQPWMPVALNTGAWQRLVTPERLAEMTPGPGGKPLSAYVPEDLPACFSMVIVTPGKDGPVPQTWFWAKKNGFWNFTLTCPEDPAQLPAVACAK